MRKSFIFVSCIYLFTTLSYCWRPYVVEFKNVSSYSLVDYIETNSSISDNGSISIYLNVLKEMSNLYTKVLIRLLNSDQVYDLEFVNKTINLCEFLKNRRTEPLLQLLYGVLNKERTFPNSCPIQKKCYYLENLTVNAEDMPPILPTNKDLAEISLMTKVGKQFKMIGGILINIEIRQIHNVKSG